TIVSIGTSLPELATTLAAAFKKQTDMALGNIVGSNIFNVLGVLGITASIMPLQAGSVNYLDLGYMLVLSFLIWGVMAWKQQVNRILGGLLLLSYLGYLGFLLYA
ncbi:MAG: sodium:calcium antiporter, partial [Cyclonatronaceae bacterium]